MKDNVSIIFAAILGTFLIVLLPLYSILDRQDSMSYNVVLTATTNFVDKIRHNGFIDKKSYYSYISELASTANTYKINIEAYKKVLINETDENGNIIEDSFIEEIQLDNTKDILAILEGEENIAEDVLNSSNEKNNVYLLSENDEIYIKVYNTNITTGSMLYGMIAGKSNDEVINISYGGIVNNVNWELYDKIQTDVALMPEVLISVPVNTENSVNVARITQTEDFEYIDCNVKLEDIEDENVFELCSDLLSNDKYTYLYDLQYEKNRTIKMALELRRISYIDVGEDEYIEVSELNEEDFNETNGQKSLREEYILGEYIKLNGMTADKDLELRKKGDYYVFNIILRNVMPSSIDYISSLASVTVLPGLGKDANGTLSMGVDTVQIELLDETVANAVNISRPINWKKFIETKNISESTIESGKVYKNEEIAFMISYTGINEQTDEAIKTAIYNNLIIHHNGTQYSDLKLYSAKELKEIYGINILTQTAGHTVVKFKYDYANNEQNYIELQHNWIATNEDYGQNNFASGAKSTAYSILEDPIGPLSPKILIDGEQGENDWYVTDVNLVVDQVNRDRGTDGDSGSGVYRNTLELSGSQTMNASQIVRTTITNEGETVAIAKAEDYVGNFSDEDRTIIRIDKTAPTAPIIELTGEQGDTGWFTSDKVVVTIIPGKDNLTNDDELITKYRIEGADSRAETEGTSVVLTKQGTSTIIATTYDLAGNSTQTTQEIKIDKSVPSEATITLEGEKREGTEWYYSDVKIKIEVNASGASGLGKSKYEIYSNTVKSVEFDGTTVEDELTEEGDYLIRVYTYTQAGNYIITEKSVKIDKQAPNEPDISIVGNTVPGENGWYKSEVEIEVVLNGDKGPSGINMGNMSYILITDDVESDPIKIGSNRKIKIDKEGEHKLKVIVSDVALNSIEKEKTIKIDTQAPIPAKFVINGIEGKNGWYKEGPVDISYEGEQDLISGINRVELSKTVIDKNTNGEEITLKTYDNAGWMAESEPIIIKLDKSAPTSPIINLPEASQDSEFIGWLLYNKSVDVNIESGVDTFLTYNDNINLDKTTYVVYKILDNGDRNVFLQGENLDFNISENGKYSIEAITTDKAGNNSITTVKNIWINKEKPATPKIRKINGVTLNDSYDTVDSKSNLMELEIDNLEDGNLLVITLINNHIQIPIEDVIIDGNKIQITLPEYGQYSIKLKQINMFKTESNESTEEYIFNYISAEGL